jgi:hypothetical protein
MGRHSETWETFVIYTSLPKVPIMEPPRIWIRPYSMFTGEVEVDGVKQPRFKYITE